MHVTRMKEPVEQNPCLGHVLYMQANANKIIKPCESI